MLATRYCARRRQQLGNALRVDLRRVRRTSFGCQLELSLAGGGSATPRRMSSCSGTRASLPKSKAEEKRVDDALCKHKIGSHEDTIFTDDPVHCFFHAFLDAWACTGFPMKHLHIFAICLDIKNGYATTI